MNNNERMERLAQVSLETARAMLEEYELVVPFGIRVFNHNDDAKMNCPADKHKDADWEEQIDMVVSELREFVKNEDVYATALVTSLEANSEMGIGLQVETELSSAMFVYPYDKKDGEWVVEQEPVQSEPLAASTFASG